METQPHPQGLPTKSKTSGLAIASLICGILGILLLPGLLGVVLGIMAIRQINSSGGTIGGKGLAVGGIVVSGIMLVAAAGVLLMASLLLPTLAKAKNKANRMKCANNLAVITKSYHAFSDEIDGATPHLYGDFTDPNGNKLAQSLGYSSVDDLYDTTRWMSAHTIRESLYSSISLSSPLDPKAIAAQRRMGAREFAAGSPVQVSSASQSYAIAMQGDLYAPETVLVMTRNLKTGSDAQRRAWYQSKGARNNGNIWMYPNGDRPWSKHIGAAHIQDGGMSGYAAEFHGEDGDEDPKHTMEGMQGRQANWGTADGAVAQGSSSGFNDQLRRAQDNFREGAAVAPGLNLTVLRPQQ